MAFPLAWPDGWRRLPPADRKRAQFHGGERKYYQSGGSYIQKRPLTVNEAITRVLRELSALGVLDGDAIVSTNLKVRLDGLPRSDQREPDDPGVAVYWQRPIEQRRAMAVDRYDRVADNIAAIAATLEAMRSIERHGGAAILDRAFAGFLALPEKSSVVGWREVLGFAAGENVTRSEIDAAYRIARSEAHPDKGGTADQFNSVQIAYDQALAEITA
jgi:hypothetical protein